MLVAAGLLLLGLDLSPGSGGKSGYDRGVMAYKFEGLTFNGAVNAVMSHDLAKGIQLMRGILGYGDVRHVGIFNRRYARTPNGDPIYVDGKRLVSGHAWHDAIDIKGWSDQPLEVIWNAARSVGLRAILEQSIGVVHVEVNYPHFTFPD